MEEGDTSADGLFTLSEVECLGACVNAPMVQVNNEYFYEDLTYDSMTQLMQDWKDGKEPKKGSQIGRNYSEGIDGRTTLINEPTGPVSRDFSGELTRYNDAKAASAAASKKM
jgi:(2Fe-2S) ferredoxin